MHPQHSTSLNWLVERVDAFNADERDHPGMTIAILAESGRGDTARAIAFAEAVRGRYIDAHITLFTQYDGTMAKWDMAAFAKTCGVIDAHMTCHRLPPGALVSALHNKFSVVYDAMPMAVKAYWRIAAHVPADLQIEADQRLAPYRILYDGHPIDNWRLKFTGQSQWEIMGNSSGFDVTPQGLSVATPLDCGPFPEADELPPGEKLDALKEAAGGSMWSKAKLSGVGKYVVIHDSSGPRCNNKLPPVAVFEAIAAKFHENGVRLIQVGLKGETRIKWTVDRLGLRLGLTNRIIKGAAALIDIEGFLPYMAFGLGTPAVVLFGPTPAMVYGFPGNYNLIRGDAERNQAACMMGTCFWGGGWSAGENWAETCRLGKTHNPEWPCCLNFMRPEDAAERSWSFVRQLVEGPMQPMEAVA